MEKLIKMYDEWTYNFMESWKDLDWKRTLELLAKNVEYYENPIDAPLLKKNQEKKLIKLYFYKEILAKKKIAKRYIKKQKVNMENQMDQ